MVEAAWPGGREESVKIRTGTVAFWSRFVVLNAIGAAGLYSLYLQGLLLLPFEQANAPFCIAIVAFFGLGMAFVMLRRWPTVIWCADLLTMLALLGTVVGLLMALRSQSTITDPGERIGAALAGMGIAFYATLVGLAGSVWLRIQAKLLGHAGFNADQG